MPRSIPPRGAAWPSLYIRPWAGSTSLVHVPEREVERRHSTMLRVDEEPRLVEVAHAHGQRLCASPYLHPTTAGCPFIPFVVDEAAPAMLAVPRRCAVARA